MYGDYQWLETYKPDSKEDLNDMIWALDRDAENLAGDMEACEESERKSLMEQFEEIQNWISKLCDMQRELFADK